MTRIYIKIWKTIKRQFFSLNLLNQLKSLGSQNSCTDLVHSLPSFHDILVLKPLVFIFLLGNQPILDIKSMDPSNSVCRICKTELKKYLNYHLSFTKQVHTSYNMKHIQKTGHFYLRVVSEEVQSKQNLYSVMQIIKLNKPTAALLAKRPNYRFMLSGNLQGTTRIIPRSLRFRHSPFHYSRLLNNGLWLIFKIVKNTCTWEFLGIRIICLKTKYFHVSKLHTYNMICLPCAC